MLRIRSLLDADVAPADEVLRAAFQANVSFQPRLRRYLALQPDGWWVAQDGDGGGYGNGDVIVGVGGAIDYGSVAYIGLMAVRPDRQGQRLGRRLLETTLASLAGRSTTCAVLDASPAGAPLYERMGFVDAGLSHEFWPTDASAAATDGGGSAPLTVTAAVTAAELADVIRLDGELFGVERPRLWGWLLAAHPERTLLARDATGRLVGYLCVQDPLLGPFGARAPEVADALLHQALALVGHRRVRLQMPEANTAGRELLLKRGFTIGRSLRHMRRGPCGPLAGGWGSIYGKGSYCLG
jgi:predicted N-acetyltransferase YhbS